MSKCWSSRYLISCWIVVFFLTMLLSVFLVLVLADAQLALVVFVYFLTLFDEWRQVVEEREDQSVPTQRLCPTGCVHHETLHQTVTGTNTTLLTVIVGMTWSVCHGGTKSGEMTMRISPEDHLGTTTWPSGPGGKVPNQSTKHKVLV
jgi:hypothetical protein